VELPEGYKLGEVENDVRVLKRPGGYPLAAFGSGVNLENIRRVAEADKRYLEAKELDNELAWGETQRVRSCLQRMLEQLVRSISWR
jgi:hypothetical protein